MKTNVEQLRAILACVLMWCLLAPACSVPDDPNWEAVKGAVAAAPPEQLEAVRRYELLRKFYEWMEGEFRAYRGKPTENAKPGREQKTYEKTRQDRKDFEDQTFLEVECTDGAKTVRAGYSLAEFEQCLSRGWKDLFTPSKNFGTGPLPQTRLFDECIKLFTQRAAESLTTSFDVDESHELDCKPKVVPMFDGVLDEGLSDEYTPEDLGRILVTSKTPPAWITVIGITVTAGVITIATKAAPILVALCVLAGPEHWSCPSSPLYPPGQAPQPTGGDK